MGKRKRGHHIIARSLGGPDVSENIYWWAERHDEIHEACHQLFRNHPPSVVIRIIEGWTDKTGELNIKLISKKDYEAWKIAFGDKKPAEVIEFVRKVFLPIEEKYLKGELKEKELPEQKKKKTKRPKRA